MNQLSNYGLWKFRVPFFADLWKCILQDFLGLVEKFFYLSGRYDIQFTVGDAVMVNILFFSTLFSVYFLKLLKKICCILFQENSFLQDLGHVELDLPEAPEKAPRPPLQPVDPYTRYGPQAEITHIFRAPEKRPPKELSLAFLGLTLLPFIGFLIGVSLALQSLPILLNKLFPFEISCCQNSCLSIQLVLTACWALDTSKCQTSCGNCSSTGQPKLAVEFLLLRHRNFYSNKSLVTPFMHHPFILK